MSMRDAHAQTLSARRPAIATSHVGAGPGLVDRHQPVGIEIQLPVEPRQAALYDIGALLLACAVFVSA